MNEKRKRLLFLLRISIGWLFFYAGITKVLDPEWTAAGFLNNAQTFKELYAWLALPENIGWVNFVNEWALTIIGAALILGISTRLASWGGIALMILYYFPSFNFPYAGEHSFLIDEHVIYILVFLLLIYFRAGKYWALGEHFNNPILK